MNEKVSINIEIPKNSNIKYEYDRSQDKIVVDRILREGFKYPANYGYIPQTLDWDGDELDILVYSSETFLPGVSLNVRLIGAMKMIDTGEVDTKLIGVHDNDYRLDKIQNISDIPQKWLDKIKKFFSTYKNWKKQDITKILGFEDKKYAINEYQECLNLMKKYGKLSKKDFLIKMKAKYPQKYE